MYIDINHLFALVILATIGILFIVAAIGVLVGFWICSGQQNRQEKADKMPEETSVQVMAYWPTRTEGDR